MTTDDMHAEGMPPNWVVESKFSPRRPNIDLVYRDRLTAILDSVLGRKLAVVIAPAGFGKSTLLTQWVETLPEQNVAGAWLTLDENDSDPNRFLALVVFALSHAGLDISDLEIGARDAFSGSPVRLVLTRLIACLEAAEHRIVLVLDDYHLADSHAVSDIVRQLLRDAPKNFSMLINSRVLPSVDAPAHIAAGAAFEMGPDQLRMTKSETATALGVTVSEKAADEIYEQTEGWPVAVQLARVQKQARPLSPLQKGATGPLVASYLTDQILSTVDDDVREFLLAVSVLERFNISLANAVRAAGDSRSILSRLEPLTAFLIPLDVKGDWHRLHHLVANHLKETLNRENPKRLQKIYEAASAWHLARGEVLDAAKYAWLNEDFETCERLVLDAGGWKVILTEGIGVLRSLLRFIPESTLNASPRLLIARSYLHCKDGEQGLARAVLDASKSIPCAMSDLEYNRDAAAVESMLNVYEDKETWPTSKAQFKERESELGSLDPLDAGTLKCEEVLLNLAIGDFKEAASTLKAAFAFMRKSGSVLGLNYCYLHAGVSALYRAELDLAGVNIARALEMAESNFGSDSGLKHMALVLDFALKVWRGDASANDRELFSKTLSHIETHDGWTEIYLVGLDAAYQLAEQCGDPHFALNVADRFILVAETRDLERLRIFARHLKMRALCQLHRITEAAPLLAEAEAFLTSFDTRLDRRMWQLYLIAVSAPPFVSGDQLEAAVASIDCAIEYAVEMGAELFAMRLRVAKAEVFFQAGRGDDCREVVYETVRQAAPHAMLGPFLCARGLKRALKELRDDLRTNEEELIAVSTLTEILTRADSLRSHQPGDLMSVREQEVLEQLADGKMNKEIARNLEMTENTVKFHLKNIFMKLGVNRRAHAIAEARNRKLID